MTSKRTTMKEAALRDGGAGYLVDPNIDLKVFEQTLRHTVAVQDLTGGWQLCCERCGRIGTRSYQDKDTALRYQSVIHGRLSLRPECEQFNEAVENRG